MINSLLGVGGVAGMNRAQKPPGHAPEGVPGALLGGPAHGLKNDFLSEQVHQDKQHDDQGKDPDHAS
jgi:hypothetical protein